MKRISGLILIITALAASGCASYSSSKIITGKITDSQSKPVAGAIVSTVPPSASVSTDSDGRYFIKTGTDGEYTIKVKKSGYAAPLVTVYVHGVELIQGDIQLLPEELAPQASTLSSTAEPKAKSEVPAAEGEVKKSKKEDKKEKSWWEK